MNDQKQISNAPMVLGIIGGITGLPAALCSSACAAGFSSLGESATAQSTQEAGSLFLGLGLTAAVLGLASAFLYKSSPKLWGFVMILAGCISGITLITFNFLSLVVCILFLIGGVIAVVQKKPLSA